MSKRSKEAIAHRNFNVRVTGTQADDSWKRKQVSNNPSSAPLPSQSSLTQDIPVSGAGSFMGGEDSVPVRLPTNFAPPEGAESIDLRRLVVVPAGQTTEFLLFSFSAQTAQSIMWYKYGVFTDALAANLIEFIPRINGKRVLRYHGDPLDNYRINLSLGPNLNESNLISCQIYMKPEDVLTWHVKNLDTVVNPMGVRMVGYVDTSLKRKTMSFGG
jgi:hypothetical protein